MSRKIIAIGSVVAITLTVMGTAGAQMNNKPFSFRNSPTGGPGMSQGGKQAIIDEKLFDITPENLQRGSDGTLVDVTEGPGKSVIVFQHGTSSSIPGFHGTSFRGDNDLMQVGVFNAYFGPAGIERFAGYSYDELMTASMINSWTMNITSGNGLAPYYGNGGSVDSWTRFVNTLNRL